MKTTPAGSRMDEEAREWFVTLLFDPGEEAILQWESWLSASPERQAAYDRVSEMWAASRHVDRMAANDLRAPLDDDQAVEPAGDSRSRPRRWLGVGLAASVVAATSAGLWAYRSHERAEQELSARLVYVGAVETGRGQHLTQRLKDGSEITAGALTRMAIALTRTGRTVQLRTGQLFVRVARDRARPFVVQVPDASVTAVGTAFDVDLQGNRTKVQVLHGTVLVRTRAYGSGAASTYVHAGRGVFIDGDHVERVTGADQDEVRPAWMRGRLEYRDIALRDVIADVNRYSAVPIVIADAAVGNLRYTGSVDVAQIQPWVIGVTRAFGLEVAENARLMVLRKNSSS